MADAISDFLFNILLYVALAVFMGAPMAFLVFFRDKLSFWPRPKWKVMFYRLKPGKEVDDTGHVSPDDYVLMPERTTQSWKVIRGKIPYMYVKQGFISGFIKDYAAFALSLEGKIIRLVEISPSVKDPSNFILLDVPKELNAKEIDGAVSGMGFDLRETLRSEFTRPQNDNWLKAHAFEIIGVIALIIIIVLTLNWSQSYSKDITDHSTTVITTSCNSAAKEIVFACGGKFINDTIMNSSTVQNKNGDIRNFLTTG